MAVQPQTPYKEYTANGSTKSFALKFDCDNQDHLIVLVDGVEPVVGAWSLIGGAVVFGTTPTTGKKITIQRNTPFRRDGDFQSYDNSFRPGPVNKGFDWIWLKLQELGVADWILSARIDALKNYVDRKDDELKAYLMEEIRKQGVALDQLDEYYNYLMERLAQIAVDKGWDASFVVDGDKTQKQINDEQKISNESQANKNLDSFSFDDVLSQNEINNSRTTDLSVKLQSVFNDPNIKKIIFKRSYYINQLVTFNRDVEWEFVGDGDFVFGATGKIEGGGTAELIGKLPVAANKYTKSLSVPVGISAGDVICIYNPTDFSFSPHRDYYRDGQFAMVADVVSGVATLYDLLYANYPTSCDIYKINRARVTIRNLKFSVNAATNNIPITIKYAKVGVYGLQSKGSDRYGLVLSRCYGVDVVGIDAKQFKSVVDGYQYGIVISNCQDMVLNGGNASGSRHGVTFGSLGAECGVPNRNVSIINATIMSTSTSAAGADIHGNADNVKYINCTIQHASVGGKNISITDSVVYGRELDGVAVWFGELIGGVVELKRTKIISSGDGGSANFGYIYAGINKDLREPLFIDADDVTLSAPNSTSVSILLRVVVVNNLQLTKKINVNVNEVKGFDLPALRAVLHFQFGSGGSTTKIQVGTVSVDNIRSLPPCAILFTTSDWDVGYDLKLMKQSGSQVINTGNGAQTLVQGALTNFKYRYPVVPNLAMSVSTADSSWNAAFSTTPISAVGSVRSNYVAPAIQSPAAMMADKNVTVGWEVGI